MKLLSSVLLFLVTGACASVPKPLPVCEYWTAYTVQSSSGEVYVIIDYENMVKLYALIIGLSDGTCQTEHKAKALKT